MPYNHADLKYITDSFATQRVAFNLNFIQMELIIDDLIKSLVVNSVNILMSIIVNSFIQFVFVVYWLKQE